MYDAGFNCCEILDAVSHRDDKEVLTKDGYSKTGTATIELQYPDG